MQVALQKFEGGPGDFTGLSDDYSKYRPGYSENVLNAILGLFDKPVSELDFVDVGAGTGIWSRLVTAREPKSAVAIEPNEDMRLQGAEDSRSTPLSWSGGSGEQTGMADHSCDLVTMASSFHWVDAKQGLAEFNRILRPNGWFVALWNPRFLEATPLLLDIEHEARRRAGDPTRVSSGLSGRAAGMSELLANSGEFDDVVFLESRHVKRFTPDEYIGVWRSVNDWRIKLGPDGFESFINYVWGQVKDLDVIEASYLTRAWAAKRA